MNTKRHSVIISMFLFGIVLLLSVCSGDPPSSGSNLILVIVVDNMRADYLTRFRPYFVPDGLQRFLNEGAVFSNARYPYAITYTAAGHASISTGRNPSRHGIIGNSWFDRVKKRSVGAAEDTGSRLVGIPKDIKTKAAVSPIRLLSETVGDRLKEKYSDSRVVSIALKDYVAAIMGGRKADAAMWFNYDANRFTTSTYYAPAPELLSFNNRLSAFFRGKNIWKLSGKVPPKDWPNLVFDPESLYEHKMVENMGHTFPHPLSKPSEILTSPYGDQLVLDLARFVIEKLHLGQNRSGHPDLLFVGMSTSDYYGHMFGPDSKEVAEGILGLDEALQEFFHWLDQHFRREGLLVFLTSDHGVNPIPEVVREKNKLTTGKDDPNIAGRFDFSLNEGRTVGDLSPERLALEKHLADTFHYNLDLTRHNSVEGTVLALSASSLYLNKSVLRKRELDPETVKKEIRDWLNTRNGVAVTYTNTEIANGLDDGAPYSEAVRRSFYADRTGDVFVVLRSGWFWAYGINAGAGHEQPSDQDLHVPLLVWGGRVEKGWSDKPVSPLSVAKTIAEIYHLKVGDEDVEPIKSVVSK